MNAPTFYLGCHHPNWLETAGVPLFISRNSFGKKLPKAIAPWALDSGGFTELQQYGEWRMTAAEYAAEVRRIAQGVGMMVFAAPQDWMCEPIVISGGRAGNQKFVGTKLSVKEHQRRTVENFLELRRLAPEIPWMPVLQGWTHGDYWDHYEMYAAAGVDLRKEPIVGVGSVCRRQATVRAAMIIADFAREGVKIHAFGFKMEGLKLSGATLASADSFAWSENARRNRNDPAGKAAGHDCKSCANCLDFALEWRKGALAALSGETERESAARREMRKKVAAHNLRDQALIPQRRKPVNFTPAQKTILDMVRAKGAVRLGQQTSAETIHAPAAIALAKRGFLVLFEQEALGAKRRFARLPPTIDERVENMPKPIRDVFEPSSAEGSPTEPAPPPSAPIGEVFPPEGWDVARWDRKMIEGYLDGLELAVDKKRCSLRFALAQAWLAASQHAQSARSDGAETAAAPGPEGGVGGGKETQEAATSSKVECTGDCDGDGAASLEKIFAAVNTTTMGEDADWSATLFDDEATPTCVIVTWRDGAKALIEETGSIRYSLPRSGPAEPKRSERLKHLVDLVEGSRVVGGLESPLEPPALAGDLIDKLVEALTDVDGASTRENASSVWEGVTVRARRGAKRGDDVAIVTWSDGAQASVDPAGKIRYNQPPYRAQRSTIRRDARLQVVRDVVANVIGSAEIVHAG